MLISCPLLRTTDGNDLLFNSSSSDTVVLFLWNMWFAYLLVKFWGQWFHPLLWKKEAPQLFVFFPACRKFRLVFSCVEFAAGAFSISGLWVTPHRFSFVRNHSVQQSSLLKRQQINRTSEVLRKLREKTFFVQLILFKVLLQHAGLTQSGKYLRKKSRLLWLVVTHKNHSNCEKENAPKENNLMKKKKAPQRALCRVSR